jgi:hypothetical protein
MADLGRLRGQRMFAHFSLRTMRRGPAATAAALIVYHSAPETAVAIGRSSHSYRQTSQYRRQFRSESGKRMDKGDDPPT